MNIVDSSGWLEFFTNGGGFVEGINTDLPRQPPSNLQKS